MSFKTTAKMIWHELGKSDKARRRNAFILIVLFLAALVGICYSGAISVTLSKVFQ